MKNTWWHSHEDSHHRDLGEWTRNNMMLYPPRKDGEPARPFEIYWGRANVAAGYKGDPLKRVCFSLNNMPITQALTYTYNLRNREGYIMYEILKEAQDYAAKEVEFPDNMHIAECFSIEFKTEFMPLGATISKVKLIPLEAVKKRQPSDRGTLLNLRLRILILPISMIGTSGFSKTGPLPVPGRKR